jgi:hypothetical protein
VTVAGDRLSVEVHLDPPDQNAAVRVNLTTPLGDQVGSPSLLSVHTDGGVHSGEIALIETSPGLYAINVLDHGGMPLRSSWVLVLPREHFETLPLLAEAFDLRSNAAEAFKANDIARAIQLEKAAIDKYGRGGFEDLQSAALDDLDALTPQSQRAISSAASVHSDKVVRLFKNVRVPDVTALAPRAVLKAPNVILCKVRDLQFGRKLHRVATSSIEGQNAIVICLHQTRRYVENVARDVSEGQIEQSRRVCLARIDDLIVKVHEVSSSPKIAEARAPRLKSGSVTRAIIAYKEFSEKVLDSDQISKEHLVPEWTEMVRIANHIWQERLF